MLRRPRTPPSKALTLVNRKKLDFRDVPFGCVGCLGRVYELVAPVLENVQAVGNIPLPRKPFCYPLLSCRTDARGVPRTP